MGKYDYIKVTGGQVYVDPNTGQRYLVKDGKIVGRNPDYLLNEVTVTPSRPSTPWEAAQRTAARMPNWRDVYGMSSDYDTMNAVTGNIMDYTDPIYWLGRATKAATGDEQLANNVELATALGTIVYPKNWLTAPRKLNAIYRAKGALLTSKAARKLMNKARRGALTDDEILKLWTSEKGRIELQENPEVFQSLAQRLSSGLKEKLPEELKKEFDEIVATTDNVTTSADNVSRAAVTNNTTQAADNAAQVANTAADNVAARTTEDIWYSVGKSRHKIPKGTPITREGDDLYVSTKHGDIKLNSAGNKASDDFQSRLIETAYEKDINDRFYKGAPVSKVTKSPVDDVIYYTTPDYVPTIKERLFTQPTYVKNQPVNWWTKVTKKPTKIGQVGPDFVKYKSRRFSPLRTATTLGTAGLLGSIIWQGGKRTLKDTASGAGSILNTIWNEGIIGADSTEVATKPQKQLTNDFQERATYMGEPVDTAHINGKLHYVAKDKDGKYEGSDVRLAFEVLPNGNINISNPIRVFKKQFRYQIVPNEEKKENEKTGESTRQYVPKAGPVNRSSTPQNTDTVSFYQSQQLLQ